MGSTMVQRLNLTRAFIALAASGIADGQETFSIDWIIQPYADRNANVGDTVEFTWVAGTHNLYVHPSGTCNLDGSVLLADEAAAGTVTFACDVGNDGEMNEGHCGAGQIVKFNVVDGGATSVEEVTTEAPQLETVDAAASPPQPEDPEEPSSSNSTTSE